MASIDASGSATGLSIGSADIIASLEGINGTANLTMIERTAGSADGVATIVANNPDVALTPVQTAAEPGAFAAAEGQNYQPSTPRPSRPRRFSRQDGSAAASGPARSSRLAHPSTVHAGTRRTCPASGQFT